MAFAPYFARFVFHASASGISWGSASNVLCQCKMSWLVGQFSAICAQNLNEISLSFCLLETCLRNTSADELRKSFVFCFLAVGKWIYPPGNWR